MFKKITNKKNYLSFTIFIAIEISVIALALYISVYFKKIWIIAGLLLFATLSELILLRETKGFVKASSIEKFYQAYNVIIQLILIPLLFYLLGKYFN